MNYKELQEQLYSLLTEEEKKEGQEKWDAAHREAAEWISRFGCD